MKVAHFLVVVGLGLAALLIAATLAPSVAYAQEQDRVEGNGYELSHGLVIHPAVGVETGFVNNLFFQSYNEGITNTAMARLVGRFDISSEKAEQQEKAEDDSDDDDAVAAPEYEFRAGGRASLETYPSTNQFARAQSNVDYDFYGHLVVYPEGTWSFLADDHLDRDVRPRDYEDLSSNNRDDNRLALGVRFQPGAHTLRFTLQYENWLDIFEGGEAANFADRFNNTFSLLTEWQWRPYTKIYAQASYGYFGPLGSSTLDGMPFKTASNPMSAVAGISTLLSEDMALKLHGGYTQSAYQMGAGYAGPLAGGELSYRWSPGGRIIGSYNYEFSDSVNANFYRDHAFNVRVLQQFGDIATTAGIDFRLRSFGGIPTVLGPPDRNDLVLGIHLRAQYVWHDRYVVYADYQLSSVETAYRATVVDPVTGFVGGHDDPSYVRNDLIVGFRVGF